MKFFFKYLGALIYDACIIFVLLFTFTGLIVLARHNQAVEASTLWYQLSLVSIALVYYCGSLIKGGQTIGMRAWRFRLCAEDGGKLSAIQILKRPIYFLPALFLAPICVRANYTVLNQWTKTRFV